MDARQFHQPPSSTAIREYLYLMDHQYPEKASLKLVGDKHQLTRDQRTVLYRGICSRDNARARIGRLTDRGTEHWIIDGYNVLLTILSYRQGNYVFRGIDRICRDAGAIFGKIRNQKIFSECMQLLADAIPKHVKHISLYLDQPVSHSAEHKRQIIELISGKVADVQVELAHSADKAILESQETRATLVTSDSAIIDHTDFPVKDLASEILKKSFHADLFDLSPYLDPDFFGT